MKQFLVIMVSLTLIVNSNCGFLDTVIGTVTDTTKSITHGVGNIVHRGKNFVFGGTEQNAAGQVVVRPGIVGTISHKIHDVSQAVREEVQTVIHLFDGDHVHGRGIIGRLFDRVKCRVFKVKSFLSGNGYDDHAQIGHAQIVHKPHAPLQPLKNDTGVLVQKLGKYLFKKDSPATSGIRQTLTSLREAIYRLRYNMTTKPQELSNDNSEHDGTGLIDIRTSVNNLGNDFEHGVDAAYDRIDDTIEEGRHRAQSSFNRAQQNTNDFIENQRRNLQNHYNQFGDNVDRFRSDVGQSVNNNIDNQRRNIQNQYNQMANNGDRFRSDLGSSINENIENQRRNLQNHYNQFNNNADRFRSDHSQAVTDNIENQRITMQNHYNKFGNNADRFRSDLSQIVTDNIENQRRNVQNHYNEFNNNADRFRTDLGQAVTDNIESQRRNVQNQYSQFNDDADRFRSDVSQAVTDRIGKQRGNVQNHYNDFGNNAADSITTEPQPLPDANK